MNYFACFNWLIKRETHEILNYVKCGHLPNDWRTSMFFWSCFFFALVLCKIQFLSTMKNTPIALMQGVMFGFFTKSSIETEQKRLVSKGVDDLPEIVQLQNCDSDRHSFKVKNSKKTILKFSFIQNNDINYSGFLLTSTECFSDPFFRTQNKPFTQLSWNFARTW